MGDRVSIAFRNGKETSVVLFDHWGGMSRVTDAKRYVKELVAEAKVKGNMLPLYRLEPGTVMVDYLREVTAYKERDSERIESGLYLAADENGGDNSDNGHHVIDLE